MLVVLSALAVELQSLRPSLCLLVLTCTFFWEVKARMVLVVPMLAVTMEVVLELAAEQEDTVPQTFERIPATYIPDLLLLVAEEGVCKAVLMVVPQALPGVLEARAAAALVAEVQRCPQAAAAVPPALQGPFIMAVPLAPLITEVVEVVDTTAAVEARTAAVAVVEPVAAVRAISRTEDIFRIPATQGRAQQRSVSTMILL